MKSITKASDPLNQTPAVRREQRNSAISKKEKVTFAYGARKSRAVMCRRNLLVFVNFPKHVPTETNFCLAMFVANFRIFSLWTEKRAEMRMNGRAIVHKACTCAGLPHVVHTVVMEPKTVCTVRSIHEKFNVFTDAVVRGETRLRSEY